jgi:serine/threonine-protein phosphatase 2A activator
MQHQAAGEPSTRRTGPPAAPKPLPPLSAHTIVLPDNPAPPQQILVTDAALLQWHRSPGFRAFWGWITRRCDRIKGKETLEGDYAGSSTVGCSFLVTSGADGQGIQSWMSLLDTMTSWIDEAPPRPQSNQRFGNLAFRDYIAIVEQVNLPVPIAVGTSSRVAIAGHSIQLERHTRSAPQPAPSALDQFDGLRAGCPTGLRDGTRARVRLGLMVLRRVGNCRRPGERGRRG